VNDDAIGSACPKHRQHPIETRTASLGSRLLFFDPIQNLKRIAAGAGFDCGALFLQ
jgi:hypothetical protein